MPPKLPTGRVKQLSIDRLPSRGSVPDLADGPQPYLDDERYDNPFLAAMTHGREWAEAGMDSEAIVAAAIALGGIPRPRGETGDKNLLRFAEHFQELHGTLAVGGQQ